MERMMTANNNPSRAPVWRPISNLGVDAKFQTQAGQDWLCNLRVCDHVLPGAFPLMWLDQLDSENGRIWFRSKDRFEAYMSQELHWAIISTSADPTAKPRKYRESIGIASVTVAGPLQRSDDPRDPRGFFAPVKIRKLAADDRVYA
jgi:hypothetical protein